MKKLTISVDSMKGLLPLAILKKFQDFFEEAIFVEKEQEFILVLELSLFQSHSTAKLLHLAIFENWKVFQENPLFSKNRKFFERFEKSYKFSCILQQNCYLSPSSKNSRLFFKKPNYFLKKPKF